METVKPVEIPNSHIEFAKAIAELADKYGMDHITVSYHPHWGTPEITGCDVMGEAQIIYRSKDGRGRKCRNLCITLQPMISHQIISNQESSN